MPIDPESQTMQYPLVPKFDRAKPIYEELAEVSAEINGCVVPSN